MATLELVKIGFMVSTLVVLVVTSGVMMTRQHRQYALQLQHQDRQERFNAELLAEMRAQSIVARVLAEESGDDTLPPAAPLPVQVERRHGMHVVRAERPMVRRVFAFLAAATG